MRRLLKALEPTIRFGVVPGPSTMSQPLSVPDLCARISGAIDTAFPDEVWVSGAISGLSRSATGHVYFDLVEPSNSGQAPDAVISVALFATARQRVNAILRKSGHIRMVDGVEVNIRGRVAHYPRTGRLQLIMSLIDPAFTLGRLAESREATLATLRAEALLERQAALRLDPVPINVALVTSAGSAAEADFCNELASSGWRFHITVYDSRVQGEGAPASLARAIEDAGASQASVVVLVRGGGAKTDLVAFDHIDVARAIARCPLPVVVGVGHEIDRSIADDVAHRSAKTPTAAAGALIATVTDFEQRLHDSGRRVAASALRQTEGARRELDSARTRLLASAAASTRTAQHRHDRITVRLTGSSDRAIERAEHRLEQARLRLVALDPARLMERGWSITRGQNGDLVRSTSDVAIGDRLVTSVADGTIESEVQ